MSAPVQVLVVGFDDERYSGDVLAELSRLAEAGIVRLIDALLVRREADGSLETLDPPDPALARLGRIAAAFLAVDDAADAGDREADPAVDPPAGWWSVADAVPVGGVAAVAFLEHVWAGPLAAAIGRSGGTALDEAWLGPEDRTRLALVEAAADEG